MPLHKGQSTHSTKREQYTTLITRNNLKKPIKTSFTQFEDNLHAVLC